MELGPYRHFMQKEIFEQPRAIADTLESVARHRSPSLFGADAAAVFAQGRGRALSSRAARATTRRCLARLWLEGVAGIPAQAEIAERISVSRQRPEPGCADRRDLAIRETADTLAALKPRQVTRSSPHA